MNDKMNNEQTERRICASIGQSDYILPVCSGDMFINAFDEFPGFPSDDEG